MKEKNSTGCSENLVEMNHITKVFHKQRAIDQVALCIPKNCVYGLLGPNGAGKSTLLKCLTGMLRPTKGEILFDGHPWTREDLNHIGALVETPPIYENLSAWENLKVRTLLLGLPDSRIEVESGSAHEHREEKGRCIFAWNETASWNCYCAFEPSETACVG